MEVLRELFTKINWDAHKTGSHNDSFFNDSSLASARKHSYAIQMMDDALTFSPNYTRSDIHAEEIFLKSLEEKRKLGQTNSAEEELFLRPGEYRTYISYPKLSAFCKQDIKRYKFLDERLERNIPLSPAELEEYGKFNDRLKIEREEFLDFARQQWIKQNYQRHNNILPGIKLYIDKVWQARHDRLSQYPTFYKQIAMIPLVYNKGADSEDNQINMIPEMILRIKGKPGNLATPRKDMNGPLYLRTDYNVISQDRPPDYSSNYPTVSHDPIAEDLVRSSEAQVVISSSGLKCLLDNHCMNLAATWCLPVNIREYKGDKCMKKVVFIDKKLPPRTMTLAQRINWYSKIGVRSLYCQRNDDLPYSNESNRVEPSGCQKNMNSLDNMESVFNKSVDSKTSINNLTCIADDNYTIDSYCDISDNEKLIIDTDDEDMSNLNKTNNEIMRDSLNVKKKQVSNTMKFDIKTEDIKSGSSSTNMRENLSTNISHNVTNINEKNNKNCYVYQMWKLGKQNRNHLMKSNGEIIPVIVRSRHDCVSYQQKDKNKKKIMKSEKGTNVIVSVNVVPKLDYQFDYGAEKSTPSESVRQWTDTFIRPGSSLKRVRINPLTCEVIQTEILSQHSLKVDCLKKNNIHVVKVWSSLYSVLSKLITLNPGSYLLEHSPKHESFTALSIATDKPGVGVQNIYTNYNVSTEDVAPIQAPWIPLDETISTPMCKYRQTLPLLFPLRKSPLVDKKKTIIGLQPLIKKEKSKKKIENQKKRQIRRKKNKLKKKGRAKDAGKNK
ncbi:uncharacterized protein LOC142333857 [Lycorma delicatula]|uniref:uncharacterized protein LOC142333857 n=1 Tax=Lycorma delicatula TaxID=130591 RepID=UPI003F5118C9